MRKTIIIGLGCTFLLLVGYAVFFSYSKSKESRLMVMSRGFIAQGQLQEARISLAEALHIDPRNVDATRLMADLAAGGSPANELQWRSRVVELSPGSAKDRIALAMAAIKAGNLGLATNSLAQVPEADQQTAEYQNAFGVIAIAQHQPLLAESAFESAIKLDPANEVPHLNLAVLRLHSTNLVSVAQARTELTDLATGSDHAYHCQALRELIADDFVHGQFNAAFGLSRQLLAETNCQFSDRILQLDILRRVHGPEFAAAISATEVESVRDSANISQLAEWELKNLAPDQTLSWFDRLPAVTQTNLPIALLVAECCIMKQDWAGLEGRLRNQNWASVEYLRHAMLARAFYGKQMLDAKTAEWNKARETAGSGIKNLTALLDLCTRWNWTVERTDLLFFLLKHHPDAKWAAPLLVSDLAASGRTRALMSYFEQQSEQDPSDLQAKNNLAMTAMLLNATEMRPFDLALQAYQMQPTNISFASTYAFSLYQQKKWGEALSVFAPFDAKTLADPSVAGYYGLVLEANGHPKQAREYLAKAMHAPRLLPEERNLFTGTR